MILGGTPALRELNRIVAPTGSRYSRYVEDRRRILIYDGDCGFCVNSASWISRRWAKQSGAEAVPWRRLGREAVEASHLSQEDFNRAVWWIDGNRHEAGSRAIGRALAAAGGPWALVGRILLIAPISWLAPICYRVVARYRHRLPGGTPACKV